MLLESASHLLLPREENAAPFLLVKGPSRLPAAEERSHGPAELNTRSHCSSYSDWPRDGHVFPAEPINIVPWDVSTGRVSVASAVGLYGGEWGCPQPRSHPQGGGPLR